MLEVEVEFIYKSTRFEPIKFLYHESKISFEILKKLIETQVPVPQDCIVQFLHFQLGMVQISSDQGFQDAINDLVLGEPLRICVTLNPSTLRPGNVCYNGRVFSCNLPSTGSFSLIKQLLQLETEARGDILISNGFISVTNDQEVKLLFSAQSFNITLHDASLSDPALANNPNNPHNVKFNNNSDSADNFARTLDSSLQLKHSEAPGEVKNPYMHVSSDTEVALTLQSLLTAYQRLSTETQGLRSNYKILHDVHDLLDTNAKSFEEDLKREMKEVKSNQDALQENLDHAKTETRKALAAATTDIKNQSADIGQLQKDRTKMFEEVKNLAANMQHVLHTESELQAVANELRKELALLRSTSRQTPSSASAPSPSLASPSSASAPSLLVHHNACSKCVEAQEKLAGGCLKRNRTT
jgi:hypothetical protein